VATDPLASWVFIVDNLNIHSSESLVRHVARLEGIDESELGTKGILKSMASRAVFLSDRNHRIRFVYLPKHSSWLNQVEVIFGIITRRILRRGNFTSTAALQERLLAFIDYFNRTFAKPFNWTYTGRPLAKSADKRPVTTRRFNPIAFKTNYKSLGGCPRITWWDVLGAWFFGRFRSTEVFDLTSARTGG